MLVDEIQIRPRYGEVDQMGYVYHANYVHYCHLARTELLRRFGIHDGCLEEHNIMLLVISMNLRYLKPARYDELLTIKTIVNKMPVTRFHFDFEITNEKAEMVCLAESTLVFVDAQTRKPVRAPGLVEEALQHKFLKTHCN